MLPRQVLKATPQLPSPRHPDLPPSAPPTQAPWVLLHPLPWAWKLSKHASGLSAFSK